MIRHIKLYFDDKIFQKIQRDKEQTGLRWEDYFISLFDVKNAKFQIIERGLKRKNG